MTPIFGFTSSSLRYGLCSLLFFMACAPEDASDDGAKPGASEQHADASPTPAAAEDAAQRSGGEQPAVEAGREPETSQPGTTADGAVTQHPPPVDSGDPSELPVAEPVIAECVFSTPDMSEIGAGADAPPPITVGLDDSPFIGDYLVNQDGKPLYIYGGDTPGDCESPPKSNCVANCVASWPPYAATPRVLAEGLDSALFGSIVREDGSQQTTYRGWPLYAFRSDAKPETPAGAILGEGKRQLWFTARQRGYNLFVMLGAEDARYLATGAGRTLYAFDQDTPGDALNSPVSACRGQCRAAHPPVRLQRLNPASALTAEDFSVFAREEGGGVQLAYRGQPLYYAAADESPGDINGQVEGWSLVEP